jgi:hypothetical protein
MIGKEPRYWFRAKRHGLGWGMPLAWQGWVAFIAWLILLPLCLLFLTPGVKTSRWAFIGAMILFLLGIYYFKGDPNGRRWNSGDS